MSDFKVGDQIKDNDPRRIAARILTICELFPNGVAAKNSAGSVFRLLSRRIYTDGKPRRSGFSLITDGAAAHE